MLLLGETGRLSRRSVPSASPAIKRAGGSRWRQADFERILAGQVTPKLGNGPASLMWRGFASENQVTLQVTLRAGFWCLSTALTRKEAKVTH
jgi:hypothetical protein